jgi:hypothetical protein
VRITFFLDVQARNYCRGMLVRNVPPRIRESLVQRLSGDGRAPKHLLEYLKLFKRAPPSCAVLFNKAGDGSIKFCLHSRNHTQSSLAKKQDLRQVANNHFTGNKDYPPRQELSETISVISEFVFINGKPWRTGAYCEYMSLNRDLGLRVGIIESFVVVTSVGRNKFDQFKTVFASIKKIRPSNLQAVEPYAANYRMRSQKSGKVREYIHASALITLLGVVPDNRGAAGVKRNFNEYMHNDGVGEKKLQYLIPMARAFTI